MTDRCTFMATCSRRIQLRFSTQIRTGRRFSTRIACGVPVALIELVEGVRMLSNVVGRDGGGSPVSTTSQDRWVDPRVADRDVFLAAGRSRMTLAFWAAR